MKAWVVSDLYDEYGTVVFAETRGKARSEALHTDTCEEMRYIEIQPRRAKWADKMYRGLREMDWCDKDDRIFLVKNGWSCVEPEYEDCQSCPAKKWCVKYGEQANPYEEVSK